MASAGWRPGARRVHRTRLRSAPADELFRLASDDARGTLDCARLSPNALAYVGDAVLELFWRGRSIWPPAKLADQQRRVVAAVRAEAQAAAVARLRRGRSAASRSPRPTTRAPPRAERAAGGPRRRERLRRRVAASGGAAAARALRRRRRRRRRALPRGARGHRPGKLPDGFSTTRLALHVGNGGSSGTVTDGALNTGSSGALIAGASNLGTSTFGSSRSAPQTWARQSSAPQTWGARAPCFRSSGAVRGWPLSGEGGREGGFCCRLRDREARAARASRFAP